MNRAAVIENDYSEEEELVTRYATLVKRIALHIISRLPASVEIDDLEQAGLIGLMDAVRQYDPSRGASFETYAKIRVRGAMIDELRRSDWSPRSLSRRVRQLSEAVSSIKNREGRDATPPEVAEQLNLSLDEYHRWVVEASNRNFFSLDALEDFDKAHDDDMDSTYGSVEMTRCRNYLSEAISSLPEREQLVLSLYYDKEMTLKEVGEVLGVSESRVCQIHGEATLRLRACMGSWQ